MKRTTCKEVRDKIRAYLVDKARGGLLRCLPDRTTKEEIEETPFSACERIFQAEVGWMIARVGRYGAFKFWQQGLHSALPAYNVYTQDNRELLQEWLSESDAEADRYSDMEVDDMFLHLLFREYSCLLQNELKNAR